MSDAPLTVEGLKAVIAEMSPPENEIFDEIINALPSLGGKCYAITGCTSGTGWHFAVAACKKGAACLIMANRPSERSTKAEADLKALAGEGGTRVVTVACDLQSLDSVKAAGSAIAAIANEYGGLDGLANNAGIMGVPDQRTVDGYDVQMQTNHLSHFLLTRLLMPSLEQAAEARGEARVCQHSSGARRPAGQLDAAFFKKSDAGALGGNDMGSCFKRYQQTKLANSVFAMALHEKLQAKASKVKSLCAEPGVAGTDLAANLGGLHAAIGVDIGFLPGFLKSFQCIQTAADGACPLIMAVFAADAGSGDFYMPSQCLDKNRQPSDDGTTRGVPCKTIAAGVPNASAPKWLQDKFENEKLSMDVDNRTLLWSVSEEETGPFVV